MPASVRILRADELSDDFVAVVRRLMDVAFEGDFDDDDWDHALGGWHAVAEDEGVVVAHAAVVPRTIEADGAPFATGYVEAVATLPDRQGEGLGTLVMTPITDIIRTHFELGALGTGAHHFYERLGWERWRGSTYARDGSTLVRTEEDDDGVMVLRTGPSAGLDLTVALVCEARAGDDW